MLKKISSHWFLIALILAFACVIMDPTQVLENSGKYLKSHSGPQIITFLIFIASGLMLDSSRMKQGLLDCKATGLALFLILFAAPGTARVLSFFPLDTGVVAGLFIISAMPTTLSSGVVMTQTAGGKMAHALVVTIISNIAGIFSVPLILSLLFSKFDAGNAVTLDKSDMFIKLCLLVLLPLFIGIVVRAQCGKWIAHQKKMLQMGNQLLIRAC